MVYMKHIGESGENFRESIYQAFLKLYLDFVKNQSLESEEQELIQKLIQLLRQVQDGAAIHQWDTVYHKAAELLRPLHKNGLISVVEQNNRSTYLTKLKQLIDLLSLPIQEAVHKPSKVYNYDSIDQPKVFMLSSDPIITEWVVAQTDLQRDLEMIVVDRIQLFTTILVQKPNLLLIYINRDELESNIAFIQKLRLDRVFLAIPILAIVEDRNEDTLKLLYKNGIDDVISRPISSTLFQIQIQNQLSRRERIYQEIKQINQSPFEYLRSRSQLTKSINKEWSRFIRNPELVFTLVTIKLDTSLALLNEHGEVGLNTLFDHFLGILSSSLRTSDEMGRWDYDTFLMLLPNTTLSGADIVIGRIREQIKSVDYLDLDKPLTCSTVQVESHASYQNVDNFVKQLELERKKSIYPSSSVRVTSTNYSTEKVMTELSKSRVLLLDSDMATQSVIKHYLDQGAWDLRIMEADEDIYDLLYQWNPDLIISEIKAWEIDAFLLCTHIRQNTQFKNIGFVILTSQTIEREKTRGFQVGVDDYLTKPFSITELEARMRRLLIRKQRGQQT